ncbi:metallophosphoesterase [bacterium]|nr:metallophosphoesterase [bacterium]
MKFKKKFKIVFFLFFFSGKILLCDEVLFKFVHLTDIHFLNSERIKLPIWQERSKKERLKFVEIPSRLKKVISWINKNGIKFVIITGDVLENMVDAEKTLEEFMKEMKELKVPYFIVPGNHDFHLEKYLPEKLGGVDFYFSCGGIIFIGLPTSNIMCTAQGDLVLKSSLEKIAGLSEKKKESPIIIMCHYPLYPGKRVNPDFVPVNSEQVREVLEKCGNVFLILQGHLHRITDDIHNGIRYITAPGFIVGPDFSFVVWEVYPDKMVGKIMYNQDGKYQEREKIVVKIPEKFRGKIKKPEKGDLIAKSIPEFEGILTRWFGKNWSYYPRGTPIVWKNEKVILPKGSSGWKFTLAKEKVLSDTSGNKWFEENYSNVDGWKDVKLPVFYGNYKNKVKEGTELKENNTYLFRLTFSLKNIPAKNKQSMLRVASDKCAEVYLNGVLIDKDKLFHWANYWNRYIIFNSSLLRKGKNLLAIKLYNFPQCTTGFLDVEIAIKK